MISIALASYNGSKYIREQLDSILMQTYQDFELIICDDCSTDNTWQILEEYAQLDHRIKIFKNEKNLGFKNNFEKAISKCIGEYIALSDQDDVWYPNHLALLYNNIGDNTVAVGDATLIDGDGRDLDMSLKWQMGIDRKYHNPVEMALTILCNRNWMQGASMLLNKRYLDLFFPMPKCVKFHDVWISLVACIHSKLLFIDIPITKYRQHGNNTSSKHKKRRNKFLICMKHLLVSNILDDRLNMIKEIEKKCSKLSDYAKQILQETNIYHKRKGSFCGRIKNLINELNNRKIIYSINDGK